MVRTKCRIGRIWLDPHARDAEPEAERCDEDASEWSCRRQPQPFDQQPQTDGHVHQRQERAAPNEFTQHPCAVVHAFGEQEVASKHPSECGGQRNDDKQQLRGAVK